jgi:ADP-ribosyl-[dinitrogen reductase] hydrolase
MRVAPVPLFFCSNPEQAIHYAGESSRTTHGARTAVDACRYFAGLIVGAVRNRTKTELLMPCFLPGDKTNYWQKNPLDPKIAAIAAGSFKPKEPSEIKGTGYVVESLEAAHWAFDRSRSFREGALLAVTLVNDADTTAAIYGQLAGAFYGAEQIPPEWRTKLVMHDFIVETADQLVNLSFL